MRLFLDTFICVIKKREETVCELSKTNTITLELLVI